MFWGELGIKGSSLIVNLCGLHFRLQNERQRKPNPWTEVDRTNKKSSHFPPSLATLLYAFVFCIWSMSSYASQLTLFIPFLTGHQVVGLMTNMKHRSLILGERLHWFVAKQLAVSTNGGWHVKLSSHETSCECLSSQRHEHVVKEGQLDDLENHLRQLPAPSMFKTWPKLINKILKFLVSGHDQ